MSVKIQKSEKYGTHLRVAGYSSDTKYSFNPGYDSWFVTKIDLSLKDNNCFVPLTGVTISTMFINRLANMIANWKDILNVFTEEHTEIEVLDKTSTFVPSIG